LEAPFATGPNQFNIEARPNAYCPPTESARIDVVGPGSSEVGFRNDQPYTFFSDSDRDDEPGFYVLSAELYSGNTLGGDLIVFGEFEFDIVS
jgi:hypothetical protein